LANKLVVTLFQVLIVHGLSGDEIGINVRAITTVSEPGTTVTAQAHCQINLVGGRFITTKENCHEVFSLIAKAPTGGYLDER
jgi:hypothetical protein